jgi:hypothetical protein
VWCISCAASIRVCVWLFQAFPVGIKKGWFVCPSPLQLRLPLIDNWMHGTGNFYSWTSRSKQRRSWESRGGWSWGWCREGGKGRMDGDRVLILWRGWGPRLYHLLHTSQVWAESPVLGPWWRPIGSAKYIASFSNNSTHHCLAPVIQSPVIPQHFGRGHKPVISRGYFSPWSLLKKQKVVIEQNPKFPPWHTFINLF